MTEHHGVIFGQNWSCFVGQKSYKNPTSYISFTFASVFTDVENAVFLSHLVWSVIPEMQMQ